MLVLPGEEDRVRAATARVDKMQVRTNIYLCMLVCLSYLHSSPRLASVRVAGLNVSSQRNHVEVNTNVVFALPVLQPSPRPLSLARRPIEPAPFLT